MLLKRTSQEKGVPLPSPPEGGGWWGGGERGGKRAFRSFRSSGETIFTHHLLVHTLFINHCLQGGTPFLPVFESLLPEEVTSVFVTF